MIDFYSPLVMLIWIFFTLLTYDGTCSDDFFFVLDTPHLVYLCRIIV